MERRFGGGGKVSVRMLGEGKHVGEGFEEKVILRPAYVGEGSRPRPPFGS